MERAAGAPGFQALNQLKPLIFPRVVATVATHVQQWHNSILHTSGGLLWACAALGSEANVLWTGQPPIAIEHFENPVDCGTQPLHFGHSRRRRLG